MLTREKKISLQKYKVELQNKLSDKTVPKKHTNRPKAYFEYLTKELQNVISTLDKDVVGG